MWILNSLTSKTIKPRRYIIWCLPKFYLCTLTKHLCPPKDENIALTLVFCALTLLYFVTIHYANVRLITWKSDLFAWRISILKYIRVIISRHLLITFEKLTCMYFSITCLNKRNHFSSCWCVTYSFHESVECRVEFGMHLQHSRTIWNVSHFLMSSLSKKQLDLFR